MPDWGYEAFLACATGDDDRLLVVGNPLSPAGRFYEVSRSPHWSSIQISAEDHPNVETGRVTIPGGVTRTYVQRMAREYGKGSNTYMSRVLGEFPDQGSEALIARSWLEGAADLYEAGVITKDGPPRIAVDPARYGPDSTVAVVRRGDAFTRIDSWNGLDTMGTANRVVELAKSEDITTWNPRSGEVVVDVVGLGAGVMDRLRELEYPVYGFNSSRKAGDASRFMNLRAHAYWHLRDELEAGRIGLPWDPKLFDELAAIEWRPTPDGRIRMEEKVELKSRLGRSPDRADAVVMAFSPHAVERAESFVFRW